MKEIENDVKRRNIKDKVEGSNLISSDIEKIKFHIISEDEVSKLAIVEVNSKTLHDATTRGPSLNGPLDIRMGVSNSRDVCKTCSETLQNCPGHWGRIKLVLPVFNIGLLSSVINVLNMICKNCSRVLLTPEKKIILESATSSGAFEIIRDECKKAKKCFYCGSKNGIVKKINFRVYHEVKSDLKDSNLFYEELNPLSVTALFDLVEVEDYKYLMIKQPPRDFLIHQMLVPPPNIRPSVDMGNQGFNEDDLTVKLSEIVNVNNIIQQGICKGVSLSTLKDDWAYLQLQVALFINSDLPSINGIQFSPIKGIVQRIKGKQGRFRMHLSGKRVDFSGRTVISPDPNLSIEEVGIPVKIAKEMTFPEKVTSFNYEKLKRLVENGSENYPGANYIIYKDGRKIYLKYAKKKSFEIGDVVERHLLNNDYLLFNRQPSLHRISIMGHRVVVHSHKTLRFNVCDCTPYNADFDGDEMNVHFPQTYEAKAETKHILGIRHNICTARNNEPLISPTQDFITGMFLLTSKENFFTKSQFYALLCEIQNSEKNVMLKRMHKKPCIIYPRELYSGKQLVEAVIEISLVNDSQITLKVKNRAVEYKGAAIHNCEPREFYIYKNRYLYGRIDKAIIGSDNRKGSLIYQALKLSRENAVRLMGTISKISVRYLKERGFSIGLSDVYLTDVVVREKNEIVRENINKVNLVLSGEDKGEKDEGELKICSYLNNIRELCGNVCIKNLSKENVPIIMQECGSKGSKINVSQMITCVGQQIVSGKRIVGGMVNRTLPHFNMFDNSPSAKGFVYNSFFTGLTSYEYFFHAVSGREGLVDTAVKTADTGYMQRRLMKALEDLYVCFDKTVRNSEDLIVQFIHGEDGLNPLFCEEEIFENIFINLFSKISGIGNDEEVLVKEIEISKVIDEELALNETVYRGRLVEDAKEFLEGKAMNYPLSINFITSFIKDLQEYINRALIEPGTAVGAITGQSIGEPGTQMTLRTFHFAGVASMNITLGVPRLKEIINAAVNISTPIINIVNISTLEVATAIEGEIERIYVKDLCQSVETVITSSGVVEEFYLNLTFSGNRGAMILKEKVIRAVSIKHNVIETEKGFKVIYANPRENFLFRLEKIKKTILETQISGFKDITNVFIKKNQNDYSIILEGTDLLSVLGTKYINPYTVSTNDIIKISKVLGIEAARGAIIQEIKYTMESHGIKIDSRHLMLLADTMTSKGDMLGITRFGIQKMKGSTLMMASFEQTADILFNAAFMGKEDNIRGVSESIILGKSINLGTGLAEINLA